MTAPATARRRDRRPGGGIRSRIGSPRLRDLWLAFTLCHLWLITLNLFGPTTALGDVTGIYRWWMQQGVGGAGWVGIDEPWVYPILAAVPMLLARLGGTALYGTVWMLLVAALNAAAFVLLIRRCRGRSLQPAWWWLGFLVALGPISLGRIDAITVPLALAGLLLVVARPAVAGALLTIGAWMKVWPAALIMAALASRRATSRASHRIVAATVGTTAVVVAGSLALGSGGNVLGFVGQQTGRGLQVESSAAVYHLWRIVFGDERYRVYHDARLLAFQVAGPGVDAVAAALTPVMVVVVLGVLLLGLHAAHRGTPAAALLGPLSLGLVAALLITNKVGSPQYVSWIAVPVIAMLVHDRAGTRTTSVVARLALVTAALTQLVFPYAYRLLLDANPVLVAVVTVRDLAELGLLAAAVVQLAALGRRRQAGAAGATEAVDRFRRDRSAVSDATGAIPVTAGP